MQTTAENQDKLGGGLHTGLDQSGTGLEGDFQAEKFDPEQIGVKPEDHDQSFKLHAESPLECSVYRLFTKKTT